MRVGLTGGIGSGKSTVSAFLMDCGAVVLDSDAISRDSTASGGAAIGAIAATFGSEFIDSTGAMNRERMRALVFQNSERRATLESIVHPIVKAAMAQQEREARAAGCRLIVLDIPLLVEMGRWSVALDAVLVVDCSHATQVSRVMQRSAMERSQVVSIVASQASRLQRRRAADAVLWNEHLSLEELGAAVRTLAKSFGL